MNEITVTIPMEYNALTRAADMFSGLANDVSLKDHIPLKETILEKVASNTGVSVESLTEEIPSNMDTKGSNIDAHAKFHAPGKEIESILEEVTKPLSVLTTPVGVDLDSDGLPHDPRIHGASKLKTKKDQKWKRIKNLEKNKPGLVEQVEAELRAAMAASPSNPIVNLNADNDGSVNQVKTTNPIDGVVYEATADHVTEPPANTLPPPPNTDDVSQSQPKFLIDNKEFTAKQLHANGWTDAQMEPFLIKLQLAVNNKPVMSFPEFMAKYTPGIKNGSITEVQVIKALNDQGLVSLVLLAARPDLVPAVDKALFG